MSRVVSPKERRARDLVRKQAIRQSYDRILIVTEGNRTEPQYFKEIQKMHRLSTAHVVIKHGKGTAPIQVVKEAEKLFLAGNPHQGIEARTFEQVYAVFDRDDHASYDEAVRYVHQHQHHKNDLNQKIIFEAIASIPCFELWILLHFKDIQNPLDRREVFKLLTDHLPTYRKAMTNLYASTREYTDIAIKRAKTLGSKEALSWQDPKTGIYKIVEQLMQMTKHQH